MKKLTEDENRRVHEEGRCPCGGQLFEGPQGGSAINANCGDCDSVIWLVPGVPGFGSEWVEDNRHTESVSPPGSRLLRVEN